MSDLRYLNVWASVVVYCNEKIAQFKAAYPDIGIHFIDWESANVQELPNGDLIGPASLTLTELDTDLLHATIAIGVSTHTADDNLFRQRRFVATMFEELRPEAKLTYYDADLAVQESVLVMTGGTLIAPMTKMDVRPWQYIQAEAMLVPPGA